MYVVFDLLVCVMSFLFEFSFNRVLDNSPNLSGRSIAEDGLLKQ